MWSYNDRQMGFVGSEWSKYKAPRDYARLMEWVKSIEGLGLSDNMAIDQYVHSLECLVLDLDKRVRELEAKAKE